MDGAKIAHGCFLPRFHKIKRLAGARVAIAGQACRYCTFKSGAAALSAHRPGLWAHTEYQPEPPKSLGSMVLIRRLPKPECVLARRAGGPPDFTPFELENRRRHPLNQAPRKSSLRPAGTVKRAIFHRIGGQFVERQRHGGAPGWGLSDHAPAPRWQKQDQKLYPCDKGASAPVRPLRCPWNRTTSSLPSGSCRLRPRVLMRALKMSRADL